MSDRDSQSAAETAARAHDASEPASASPSPASTRKGAKKGSTAPRVPWEAVLQTCWKPAALLLLAAAGLAFLVWGFTHLELLFDYFLQPENGEVRTAQAGARNQLLFIFGGMLVPAAVALVVLVRRARLGQRLPSLHLLAPVAAATGLPFLFLPTVEYEHPYLTAIVTLALGLTVAYALRSVLLQRLRGPLPDLTPRLSWILVGAGWLVFVGVIGFIAHWRYITFHAEPYDSAWETNAVWGIVHHGVPTISTGAESYYRTKHLPAVYFDLHTPFSYYLYAPFFALWQDARMLLWMQAMWLGAGAAGVYLFGRRWLRAHWAGVALAWTYLLNPFIQNFGLHDIHANILAVPTLLVAMGLMETGRLKTAVGVALFAAVCREETPLYAACLGLFWTFSSGGDRRRVRAGLLTIGVSLVLLVLITGVLMPAFGGQPRWGHFSFFFGAPGMASQIQAFLLNPLGAVVAAGETYRAEFFFMAFLPLGFLAIMGWRGAWFLLLVAAMLVASRNTSMFSMGVNYSAPVVPAVLVMSYLGMRAWLVRRRNRTRIELDANRATIVAYVLLVAVVGNVLYGNILAKSYKIEYGESPYRRQRQYDYRDRMGYVVELPAFGQRERDLWAAIEKVPPDGNVSTSWSLNAQMSTREVALTLPYLGEQNPPDNLVRWVIIDKLPPMILPSEKELRRFRSDPAWEVAYENAHAAVFKRR